MSEAIDTLFTSITGNPEDHQSYLILADALTQVGDVRGELITVQHALAQGTDDDALRTHEAKLIADRRAQLFDGVVADYGTVGLEFRLGFLDTVRLSNRDEREVSQRALEAIFRSRETLLLRTIVIDPNEDATLDDFPIRRAIDHLVGCEVSAPALQRLMLGSAHSQPGFRFFSEYGDVSFRDDLSRVLVAFPSIAELRVDLGAVELEWAPLSSERLRMFTYISPFVRTEELAPLAASTLPALESFVLWTGGQYLVNEEDEAYDGDLQEGIAAGDLEPLLAMLACCEALTELGICNFAGNFAELATVLANSAVLPRIERLDLSACRIDGSALFELLERAPKLRSLRLAGSVTDDGTRARLPGHLAAAHPALTLEGELGDGRESYRLVIAQE